MIIKRIPLLLVLLSIASSAFSQEKSSVEIEKEIYQQAKRYRDFEVARTALYKLIVMSDDTKRAAYRDTLAQFYFETRSYAECILLCTDILTEFPNKLDILNIRAISEQTVGLNKNALEDFEKLNGLEPSLNNVYQIATLQYGLGRFGECEMSINSILIDPKSQEQKIGIIAGQQQQNVMLKAAAFNMKGVLYKDLNRKTEAIALFSQALVLEPEFLLAQANLEVLNTELSPEEEEEAPIEKEGEKSGKKKKR